ncbi:hypothetical protein ACFYXQ_03690 [Nocardia jiangxiensis]|uniref:Uncharacterized protein n=1 Tax=Nocardia jiangxiensis TaxID=282685 RepID=A0ABW6RS84_9NOCA
MNTSDTSIGTRTSQDGRELPLRAVADSAPITGQSLEIRTPGGEFGSAARAQDVSIDRAGAQHAGDGLGDEAAPPAAALPRLSPVEARDLTDRIKVGVEAVWELVKQAYVSRAWLVLGYDSWDDYCTREFGNSRLQVPRENRSEVVASMREFGMSTRAIAAVTGMGHGTVVRNLPAGVPNGTPAPVMGVDGKTYQPKPPVQEPVSGTASGRGPEQRPVRRRPITEAFWEAARVLAKDTERIARLAADARFTKNSDRIAGAHLSDLVRARDAVQRVIDRLTPEG